MQNRAGFQPFVRTAAVTAMLGMASTGLAQDAMTLRQYLVAHYPSLAYVDRFRATYADDALGNDRLWNGRKPPSVTSLRALTDALLALADRHVSVRSKTAGPPESLGVLFRSSSDGLMVVWRVLDERIRTLRPGDVVTTIDGVGTARWLRRAAERTFGGNARSRAAQAALDLGLANRLSRENLGLGDQVKLGIATGDGSREVELRYQPMGSDAGARVADAVNRADLPQRFTVGEVRVGSLRIGAFAPQYDPTFLEANAAAEKLAGTTEDQAMVAGFCAVVRKFAADADAIARDADVLVLDVRGNLGGFGREARLMAAALTATPLPRSFDVFRGQRPGVVRLQEQPDDASCARLKHLRPLIVLTDAGTRSSGEFIAAWLWSAGAIVAGERTIGAGGGLEFGASGFQLPGSDFSVLISGNFTVIDPAGTLANGELGESALIDTVAQDRFAPSRTRYYAFQAVGVRPDIAMHSTLDDLRDSGVAMVGRIVAKAQAEGRLPAAER
jgi:hypothetical protein